MGYFKSVKKKKMHIGLKLIISIMVIWAIFEIIQINYKRIKSDDINESIENKVEQLSQCIVGIIQNNEEKKIWGSGVVVSKDGYIMSNCHVTGLKDSLCEIYVDNTKLNGKVIWANKDMDISIVKVDRVFENYFSIGNSDDLKLGEEIYSIGNPISKSFQKSITKGVISGLNRNLKFEEDDETFYLNNLIQTDCAINLGNSGGALIDKNGNLVGITTIKISSAELMGFAIPINSIKPIISKVQENESFEVPTLNIWGYDKYSIQETEKNIVLNKGVYIEKVLPNSNSELAGLRTGDVILNIDTEKIEDMTDLKEYIFQKNPGDNVIIKIYRDSKEFIVNVKLEELL